MLAFSRALGDLLDPRIRRILALSFVGAAAILVALGIGLGALLHHLAAFESAWLRGIADLAGGLGIIILAWLLFPAAATLALGFFLETALAASEARHYPGLPPPRGQGIGEMLRSALRLAILAIAVGLLTVLLTPFLPGLNLVIYYGLNGWLLGREYFELVAQRRLDERELRTAWRVGRARLIAAGVLIALLLTVPVVNLAAPLIAALFMLHLFESPRQGRALALVSR